jgi:hypothetical protein
MTNYTLRIPPELYQRIQQAATRSQRSNHGEILWLIGQGLAGGKPEPMTYNGWSNYETWAAKLWMDNDQGWYYEIRDLTRAALTDADGDKDEARRELADSVKDSVETAVYGDDGETVTGLAADLLRAAFSEIDFYEIAENLIDDEYDTWREDNPAETETEEV